MPRILLIGNGRASAADLAEALSGGQFQVHYATTEAQALDALVFSEPNLIVVEALPPAANILTLCQRLRRHHSVPIVVCSTSSREQDVVRALEAGADDYLILPVRPVELLARLKAVLRRAGESVPAHPDEQRLVAGDLELWLDEHRAFRRGVPVELSPIEFKLLALLMRERGRPISHSRLIAQVWGPEYVDCRHYLRLYIRYLRSKIEDNPENPELIVNEWGVGYRFEPSRA